MAWQVTDQCIGSGDDRMKTADNFVLDLTSLENAGCTETVAPLADDRLEIRVTVSDSASASDPTSESVTLQPDDLRWRHLLPDRNAKTMWSFWDPRHERILMARLTGRLTLVVTELWEFAVDATTGSWHWSRLPDQEAWLDEERLFDGSIVYDAGNRQGILIVPGDDEEMETWRLDLSDRGTPVWEQLTPNGTAPSNRRLPNLIHDSAGNRILMIGGVTDTGALGDIWALDVSDADAPTWESLPDSLPFPVGAASVVSVPNEPRAFLLGGLSGSTSQTRVFELDYSGEPLSISVRAPLPTAMVSAVNAYVRDPNDRNADRIYIGYGIESQTEFVPRLWTLNPHDPNADFIEVSGVTTVPTFVDAGHPRATVYDERTGVLMTESVAAIEDGRDFKERGVWGLRVSDLTVTQLARYGEDLPPSLSFPIVWTEPSLLGLTGGIGDLSEADPLEELTWRFDPELQRFLEPLLISGVAPRAMIGQPSLLSNDDVVIFSGLTGTFGEEPDDTSVWLYREGPMEREQTVTVGETPDPSVAHTMFRRCGSAFVFWYYIGTEIGYLRCQDGSTCRHVPNLVTGVMPPARAFAAMGYDSDRKTLLFGGSESDSQLWGLGCGDNDWEVIPTTGTPPSTPLVGQTMTPIGAEGTEEPFLLMGDRLEDNFELDVYLLSRDAAPPAEYHWEKLAPAGPQPKARQGHAAFYWNGGASQKIYIYGGLRDNNDDTAFSDLWELRLPTGGVN